MYAHLPTFAYMRLLNKSFGNEVILVIFREKNISFKCCKPIELLIFFGRALDLFIQMIQGV